MHAVPAVTSPRMDFETFRTTMADAFVSHAIRTENADLLTATASTALLGDVHVAHVSSSNGHGVYRTPAHIGSSSTDQVKVSLQLAGSARFHQGGRSTTLPAGHFVLYDTARPYALNFPDRYSSVIVMVPRHLLPLTPGEVAILSGRAIDSSAGLHFCVQTFLGGLVQQAGHLTALEARTLGDTLVDLLGMSLRSELPHPAEAGRRAALHAEIVAHIDAHLPDPELSPASIAADLHVSLSHLHAVFAASGETVAAYIRNARLERCRKELRRTAKPIQVIAQAHGFTSAAHFSRAFRARFGRSPREERVAS